MGLKDIVDCVSYRNETKEFKFEAWIDVLSYILP